MSIHGYGLNLTTDAARGFLDWIRQPTEAGLERLLHHPGYQAVLRHSRTQSLAPVRAEDFWHAQNGQPSNLYGLRNVRDHACDIERLAAYVERNRTRLLRLVAGSLLRLFPAANWQNTELHCIVGYDLGIGLNGQVAINLNTLQYLTDAREIEFRLIHEAAHVAYERIHGTQGLTWFSTPGGLLRQVQTLIQNEGLAVYAALEARRQAGSLHERDYLPLSQAAILAEKVRSLLEVLQILQSERLTGVEIEEVLSRLTAERLAPVVGCHLFELIERRGGLEAVRQAALLAAPDFISRYQPLLRPLMLESVH